MDRITIKNRKGQNIAVALENPESPAGLAFIMHGLGGFKEQPHIKLFANVFEKKGYAVVSFDTTNTIGESAGDLADATMTNYYDDLEDVIKWAGTQSWYQEPFAMAGHSLGGMAITLFAEKYPEKVKALAPTSTVVSGFLTEETPDFKEIVDEWKKKGIREWESSSAPGVMKRLKWAHVEDRRKYDIIPGVGKLKMPVLLIVGELDDTTPLEQQQLLFDKLPGKKELHVIKGAEHTFKAKEHLDEIEQIFLKWIDKLK